MLGKKNFIVWNQSFSFFFSTFNDVVLGFNTTIQRKFGHKNDVWLNYFGNSYNIRGWALPNKNESLDNSRFGHEFLYSSFELRKLIFKKNGPKPNITKGICLVAFADIGAIEKKWGLISKNSIIGGAGVGIRVPIPILQSVRVDLGWGFKNENFNKNCTIHFAVQQKF
jgi:outer membrane protein assembly factor BamA